MNYLLYIHISLGFKLQGPGLGPAKLGEGRPGPTGGHSNFRVILFDLKGRSFLDPFCVNEIYLQNFAHLNQILDSYKIPDPQQ